MLTSRLKLIACWVLAGSSLGQAQTNSMKNTPPTTATLQVSDQHQWINVYFKEIDAQGDIVLLYGGVPLKTRLAGLTLRTDAPGIIKIFLPIGVLLRAELVKKGPIPTVVLWKGITNLNQQLVFHGGAVETTR